MCWNFQCFGQWKWTQEKIAQRKKCVIYIERSSLEETSATEIDILVQFRKKRKWQKS